MALAAVVAGLDQASRHGGLPGRSTSVPVYPQSLPQLASTANGPELRRAFAFDEQVMGSYLVTLPALTRAISVARDHYGWMAGGFGRQPSDPSNARTQENVATLAWFYSQQRAWNPYFRSPELLSLLEAALSYYLRLQAPDGSFPEGHLESPRAATGFALIYLGDTYRAIAGMPFDASLRSRLLGAIGKAADWFLSPANADVWESAVYTSNQVMAGLLGCSLLAGELGAERRQRWWERLRVFLERAQSPAGYPYENQSVDFGYTTGVMLGDLAVLMTKEQDERLRILAQQAVDFCSYNYLWEPDGVGFVVNGGIGAREAVSFLDAERSDQDSFTDLLALARQRVVGVDALLSTEEGRAERRRAWVSDPRLIPPLPMGAVNPIRPRIVLLGPKLPPRADRLRALDHFRYRSETAFIEQRDDTHFGQHFAWLRQPGYYLAAFWGRREGRQRSGLGFLYHPGTGTFVCTQPAPDPGWGWSTGGAEEHAANLDGVLSTDRGIPELILRSLTNGVSRTLQCRPVALRVGLQCSGDFVEQVPLVLRRSDTIHWRTHNGLVEVGPKPASGICLGLVVVRGAARLTIDLTTPTNLVIEAQSATLFRPDARIVRSLQISARNVLSYEMSILQ